MAFLVTCIDKENSLELRLATREKHINYLKGIGDKVILAGPIFRQKRFTMWDSFNFRF